VHQCVVIGVQGKVFWFGRGIDANGASLTTDLDDNDIIFYPDDYVQSPDRHPMEYLAGVLQQRSMSAGRIGVEKDNYYFSASAAESLYAQIPFAVFVDATALVNWQRAVKSEQELKYMRHAGRIVEKIYERVMEVAEPGMRKNELVAEILHAGTLGTSDHYGDYAAIVPLIGAGDEASAAHMTWDGSPLDAGSGMFLELAGAHAHYHCPCSRTLYFGKPPQEYRDVFAVFRRHFRSTLPKSYKPPPCQ
jgi:ectoine hydrolase